MPRISLKKPILEVECLLLYLYLESQTQGMATGQKTICKQQTNKPKKSSDRLFSSLFCSRKVITVIFPPSGVYIFLD